MNDYDNITSSNYTDILNEYDDITSISYTNALSNCTDNEIKFDIIKPTLLLTIPSGLSFLCLMSLMAYTLIKPLFNNK